MFSFRLSPCNIKKFVKRGLNFVLGSKSVVKGVLFCVNYLKNWDGTQYAVETTVIRGIVVYLTIVLTGKIL